MGLLKAASQYHLGLVERADYYYEGAAHGVQSAWEPFKGCSEKTRFPCTKLCVVIVSLHGGIVD